MAATGGGTQTRSEGSLFPRILSEPLCLCPRLVLLLGLLHSLSRHPCLVSASSPEIPGHAGELSLDLSLTFPSSHDLETATSATLTRLPVLIDRRALLLFRFFLSWAFSAAFLSCRPPPTKRRGEAERNGEARRRPPSRREVRQRLPLKLTKLTLWSSVLTAHMGKGEGKGGDAPPLRVKNKSPPLHQKNGYPSQKILDLFYSIPPFLVLFHCACLFFQSN